MPRTLTFAEAIHEATDQCMAQDPSVYVMGLGVPDPKGIFGTTLGLQRKYGPDRVMDMPVSENGMTGVAIGSALRGMRPIITHQRLDFMLLSLDQIINNAAKWRYMFGGQMCVPMVIRAIIGRGWGQGPQHSQSLQALFTHIPGLRVVMPSTPSDAKGLLVSAIHEDNPVIFLEHRWLHHTVGDVSEACYEVPLGEARVAREGTDVTLVASSYMTLECLRAAEALTSVGVSVEVVDLRSLAPLDESTLLRSVKKTGRLVVVDGACRTGSFAAEVVARMSEGAWSSLSVAPRRICFPDFPAPTSPALTETYYPTAATVVRTVQEVLGLALQPLVPASALPHDVPDPSFRGPF